MGNKLCCRRKSSVVLVDQISEEESPELLNPYFSHIEIRLSTKEPEKFVEPFENEFCASYDQLCKENNCFSVPLGDILSRLDLEFDWHQFSHFVAVIHTHDGYRISIPFSLLPEFQKDLFPVVDVNVFKQCEALTNFLPSTIELVFKVDQETIRFDYTKQLMSFSWDLFHLGAPYRPHAWTWLRDFIPVADDNSILLCRRFGAVNEGAGEIAVLELNSMKLNEWELVEQAPSVAQEETVD